MICKLCGKEKTLIKKSHIIPGFMYEGILIKGKKIANINLDNVKKNKFSYTGIYDRYILCSTCDNEIIGGYETYASKIFYKGNFHERHKPIVNFTKSTDGILNIMSIQNIDYKKFKLFLLSILWRASISNDPFFGDIELGGKYEQELGNMIYKGDPGEEDQFQTCVFRANHSNHTPTNIIGSPRRLTVKGNTQYAFFINGFYFFYNVSSYNKETMYDKGMIYKNNTMDIALIDGEEASEFFYSFIGKRLRSHK